MPSQPLLIQLLFHPHSTTARKLAQHIHRQLNDDVVVPGLRLPSVFCPLSDGGKPPASLRLDISQHSFVVPLADDELCVDDDWCRFVADVWESCASSEDGKHRCVPMQLSKNAWPLDHRLREVNFGRAFALPDVEARNNWVTRRVVIELCRFLQVLEATDDHSRAPTQLFLSHAKADMHTEPRVAQQLINFLSVDQPVDAWVDSGEIETGSKFSDAIRSGVKRTSLLAILTDNYSSREWCREEVMLAKEHQRPIVVVDALMTHEVRSFPFLDNVPKLRWNGNPQTCVDMLLKESLRHLHTREVLSASQRPDDIVFLRPPEPAMLLGIPAGSNILYPDPPLGVGELKRLARSNAAFSTPLQRSTQSTHPKIVAMSMSESTDLAERGMDELHLLQTMAEVSRHLLIRGSTLAYGGHLGSKGYTPILFELVQSHNDREGVKPFERIINHRGWPLPKLSTEERAKLIEVSTIVPLARPADVDESRDPDLVAEPQFFPGDKSAEHRFAWCRGMTEMRAFQSNRAQSQVVARVVLGGVFGPVLRAIEGQPPREQWYSSRMPGVLEEVLLSIQAGQPVFLIGAFGGVAKLVIDLLQGRGHPAANWTYQSRAPFAGETRDLYAARGQKWWYFDTEPRAANMQVDDPRSIVSFLADAWKPRADVGWETSLNPLTRDQNLELFETADTGRMVELALIGLNAVK